MKPVSQNSHSPKYGYLALFVALSATLLIYPFLHSLFFTRILMRVFLTAIFLTAIYVISNSRWTFILGLLLVIPSVVFSWTSYVWPNFTNQLLTDLFSFLFSVLIITVFFKRSLLDTEKCTKDQVFATLCVYLLLGLAWADGYALIETLFPNSFSSTLSLTASSYAKREVSDFIYYSYVTLTTLGYGDIIPISLQAKFFSVSEAITGQLFIATAIAKSVGIYIKKNKKR